MNTAAKHCSKCGEYKSLDDFYKRKKSVDGLNGMCIDCVKKWKNDNKDKIRNAEYLSRYGISLIEYEEMLRVQNNRCATCGKHETEVHRKILHVDHCHETEKVRGLLCRNCNVALGFVQDSEDTLTEMILYLRKFNEQV